MSAYTNTVILGVTGEAVDIDGAAQTTDIKITLDGESVVGPVTDAELRASDVSVVLTLNQIEDLKDLLREVVIELRVLSDLVSQGMNVKDDVGLLRLDAESDFVN